jgi:hypothetical protein
MQCGVLDCHVIGTCEKWGRVKGIQSLAWQMQKEGGDKDLIMSFVGVFNACVVALEEGIDTHDKIISSFEEVLSQMCGE